MDESRDTKEYGTTGAMMCPGLNQLPVVNDRRGWPWDDETEPIDIAGCEGPWPRITLVMPSFNQVRYIEEAIRSVLLQGYPDLEFIVMDGGSTDGTVDIIKKYDQWISYWVSEKDRGQSHAINKGLALATGTYFNWHNSDDILTRGSLRRTAEAFIAHPQASSVTGYLEIIDDDSRVTAVNDGDPLLKGRSGFLRTLEGCLAEMKVGGQPGSLMDLALVRAMGGVDESIHYAMDADLQLRLLMQRPTYHVDAATVRFRLHADSKTCSYVGERAVERFRMIRKMFSSTEMPVAAKRVKTLSLRSAHRFAAELYRNTGQPIKALCHETAMAAYSLMIRMGRAS